jgi:protein TonB
MATRLRQPAAGLARAGDHVLVVALVVSALLHGGMFYGAERWGSCLCNFGKVVCPKLGQDCHPRVNLQLVDRKPPPPPPPKPEPRPAVLAPKPAPDKPPAAPKAGKVVLPDEAFKPAPPSKAEITLDRPSLPEDVVVKESEAQAPIVATGEIFGRANELSAGEPGVFGLGGTGTGLGVGPFGTEKDGGGAGTAETRAPVAPPPPPPKPEPKPQGPTRPPRVLNWTDPPYPEQARQQGIEGTVTLKLTVTASGRAQNVSVSRSSGNRLLDGAAVAHLRKARFSPALKNGAAVPMTITFKVKFRLVNT